MKTQSLALERVERAILLLRGQRVMLDADLAALYGVSASRLNEQVKRNLQRFPEDFMFQLTSDEVAFLRSQIAILEGAPRKTAANLRSQIATSSELTRETDSTLRSQFVSSIPHGGRRYLPYAFTEQGVAMLSTVLRSPQAVAVNIEIMRAFVRLRQMLQTNAELSRKLAALEKKYDAQFRVVFEAIRELMTPPVAPKKRIGFR